MEQAPRHPLQPLVVYPDGVVRFKENAIVRALLDTGALDMNKLARMDFSVEDREQFAQLIGYSLSGFGDLSYVRTETYCAAEAMRESGLSEDQARIASLQATLDEVRSGLREAAVAAFRIHPDDLHD